MLKPLLGRELRKNGHGGWGVVDAHGVGVTCSKIDGALKWCHDAVKHFLAREARAARMSVVVEVFGAFTRAFREADAQKAQDYLGTRSREVQGIIPDLQINIPFYELKGIRSDSSHTNYNGAATTGVAKREGRVSVDLSRRAEALDAKCFGVHPPSVGPWQRALNEAGGVRPLVFGQYWETSAGLDDLLQEIATIGADQAADRYLLESPLAAVGVQRRLLRQRLVCCIAKAQSNVLLRRLHYCLPGWDAAEGRRMAAERSERRRRQEEAQARDSAGERRHGAGGEWDFRWDRSCR